MWMYAGIIIGGYVLVGILKLAFTWIRAYWLWMNDNKDVCYTDGIEEREGIGIIRSHAHTAPFLTIVSSMRKAFFTVYARRMPNEEAYEIVSQAPSWFLVFVYIALSILIWPTVGVKMRPHVDEKVVNK